MDSSFILESLKKRYPAVNHLNRVNKWLVFPELRTSTGYKNSYRAIDLFIMSIWPSDNFLRIAFEIKISSSDFHREKTQPIKRRPAMLFANQFYFVTPENISIKADAIPLNCGWMRVNEKGLIHTRIPAPMLETEPPNWAFIASMARELFSVRQENYE